jgi:hypothetical protein
MLDVGLSSTARIAEFFGISPRSAERREAERPARAASRTGPPPAPALPQMTLPKAGGPQKVIEDALRKAGLMR